MAVTADGIRANRDGDRCAGRRGRRRHTTARVERAGERLLAEDVFALREGSDGDGLVRRRRRGDGNGVDLWIADQRLPGIVRGEAQVPGGVACELGAASAD